MTARSGLHTITVDLYGKKGASPPSNSQFQLFPFCKAVLLLRILYLLRIPCTVLTVLPLILFPSALTNALSVMLLPSVSERKRMVSSTTDHKNGQVPTFLLAQALFSYLAWICPFLMIMGFFIQGYFCLYGNAIPHGIIASAEGLGLYQMIFPANPVLALALSVTSFLQGSPLFHFPSGLPEK